MQGTKILEQLKEEIPEHEYEHYLKQLHYIEEKSKSNLLVFGAPNILIAKWIKTKYAQRIAQLFEREHGLTPKVDIILPSEYKTSKSISKIHIKNRKKNSLLDFTCTFETFVVGTSNRLAYNAALRVAQQQAAYNPLLIYGGTGLGKTHLLNAIGNFVSQHKSVNYVTSEQFLNDFLYHIRNKTMDRFKEKYRSSDYLLIDDVQFFARGEESQNEFFHTFNELQANKKQIVLTSDKHPNFINKLDDRLKSRFVSGMICDIQSPELETKINIIKNKCETDKIYLSDDVIYFIATNVNSNIREIGGIMINIHAAATLIGQEITLEFAKNLLKEHIVEENINITLDRIIEFVSKEFNMKLSEITSKSRKKDIVLARRIVIYLARTLTPNSMPSLAQSLGMKDHSSVSKAYKAIENEIKRDNNFKIQLEELQNRIKSKN